MKSLELFEIDTWEGPFTEELQKKAVRSLENGKVLYFPNLAFPLADQEKKFLDPQKVDPKAKNISYDRRNDKLGGTLYEQQDREEQKALIRRYASSSRHFLDHLIPHYRQHLIQARTSLRPVEIAGRTSSWRKDDTRLHVDAFPSSPTKGQRILRMFTNINPEGKPRVWRLGEPFQDVVKTYAPTASRPIPGIAYLMKWFGITKDLRTRYDHYMLKLHDQMKADLNYQECAPQEEFHFPPGSSWIVYTDQVSHAAMSGQHVFEQTFHVPVQGLYDRTTSPLGILEQYLKKSLT